MRKKKKKKMIKEDSTLKLGRSTPVAERLARVMLGHPKVDQLQRRVWRLVREQQVFRLQEEFNHQLCSTGMSFMRQ